MQLAFAAIDENVYGIRITPRLIGIEILTVRSFMLILIDYDV